MHRLSSFVCRSALLGGLAVALWWGPEAQAQSPRRFIVDGTNEAPTWMVRVDVNKPDRIYRLGDLVQITVTSEQDGFLYLLNIDPTGETTCLFPNGYSKDNRITASKPVVIPGDKGGFAIRIGEPVGKELLAAYVTKKPISALALQDMIDAKGYKSLKPQQVKRMILDAVTGETGGGGDDVPDIDKEKVKLKERDKEKYKEKLQGYAEHSIEVTTVGKASPGTQSRQQRVGVFIGLSRFQSQSIRPLNCGDKDAERMAALMKSHGKFDNTVVLLNEQATLKNIQKAIRDDLPAMTRAGDLVMIYWSGHGSRCADFLGGESDGYREFLVPHDGDHSDIEAVRNTMLLDDTFGRWVQGLDGRKVVVILDACHSAGQANAKMIESKKLLNAPRKMGGADLSKTALKVNGKPTPMGKAADQEVFFFRGLARVKNIGQRECAVLASSTARQPSYERRERDLSVMTFYLVQALEQASGPVTLDQVFQGIKSAVGKYVADQFPGTEQTPVLVDETTPPVYLRQ